MDPTVNEKLNHLRDFLVTVSNDTKVSIFLNMMDNETLFKLFEDLYLQLQLTQEQAYTELVEKLKLEEITDEQQNKVKRYIQYFYSVLELKFKDLTYEELLKKFRMAQKFFGLYKPVSYRDVKGAYAWGVLPIKERDVS
jgi:hypothetical protein